MVLLGGVALLVVGLVVTVHALRLHGWFSLVVWALVGMAICWLVLGAASGRWWPW